jgi:hypothetical protein
VLGFIATAIKNKKDKVRKEEIMLPLCSDNFIIYLINPKESNVILLDLINIAKRQETKQT